MDVSLLTVVAAVLGVSLSVQSDAATGLNKESALPRVHTVFKQPPSAAGGMRRPARNVTNDIGDVLRDTTTAVYDSTKNGIQEVGNRLGGATNELTGGFFSGGQTQPGNAPANSTVPPPGTLPPAMSQPVGAANAFAQNSPPQPATSVDPRYSNAGGGQPVPVASPGGFPGWSPDPAAQGRASQVGATQPAGATQNVLPPDTNRAQDPGSNPFSAGGPQFPERSGQRNDTRSVLVGPPPTDNDAWNTPISATTSGSNEPRPPGGRQSIDGDRGGERQAPAGSGDRDEFVPLRRVNELNAGQNPRNANQRPDANWGADSWRRDNSANWSGNSNSNFGGGGGGGDGDLAGNRGGWPATNGGGASPGSWPAWPNAGNPGAGTSPRGGLAANSGETGWDANWQGPPSGAVTTAGMPPGAAPGTNAAMNPPATGNLGLPPGVVDPGKAPAREAWVPLLAVSTALVGSLGANLFLGFSYMDARHRYLSAIRRATRFGTRRD